MIGSGRYNLLPPKLVPSPLDVYSCCYIHASVEMTMAWTDTTAFDGLKVTFHNVDYLQTCTGA